jgi:type II restriction/modification system DNA methylase subunit YeeA
VVSPEHRGGLGMHYTSVPNIMKLIKPLFLNGLYEEFEAAAGNRKKLNLLLNRMENIKIFDPACGSGNFLIIAYKELRRLEIQIFKELKSLELSNISLNNFFGIEMDDFAQEVATLSLWLAEHQMNQEFFKEFGRSNSVLPLKETGNIIHGNACRLDWDRVCPKNEESEVYILGNPPYLGCSLQSPAQKADMSIVFGKIDGYKNLDYISCWFLKASMFIHKNKSQFAFVSTNSICQGEQVASLWPHILDKNLEVAFAYTSFKWKNNAKDNAVVTVAIIGVRNCNMNNKFLYYQDRRHSVKNINPYLAEADNLIIQKRNVSISNLQQMDRGTGAIDGGNLILNQAEMNNLIHSNKGASKFIKKFSGAD